MLDEQTPNTPNGSKRAIGYVHVAKLLKDVEKKHDTGIKILNESKKIDARADLRGGKKTNKDKISSHYDGELGKMSRGKDGEDADVTEDTARYRTVSELAGEIDPTVTLEDYYEYTDATFDAVKTVDHSDDSMHPYDKRMQVKAEWEDMKASHPDWEWHRSPKDGSRSEYLIDRENGDVYRYSDHWGVVATSNWKLNGSDVRYETAIGKANISDFRCNNVTAYKYAKAERIIRLQRAEQFPAMRAEAERLGMKFNVRINVIEDVESITHSVPYIQERRRRSKGWYDTATGGVYIVLPNNRDVEDVRATVFHETVGHKGLRELIGEKGYGGFLREVYEHADKDVRRRIDSLAEKNRWNRDKATDEYLSVLAEKDFKDFDQTERSAWQWLKDKVLKAIDMFLGSLRLPEWVRLSDNELRYILWRSKERLERGKESPMDTARDVVKRRELGNDNGLYSMGYSEEELDIISRAKADGSYMQAPNGKPTNLSEKQWAQVRTEAFKEWFGDWEKASRIEKLRNTEAVEIRGDEYKGKYELNRESAKAWLMDNLRDEYPIDDTGENVSLSRKGINKVTSHSMGNEAHLKSLIAVPSMLKRAIFITEEKADKANAQYPIYRYYVVGLNIGGVDYTAKLTIGVDKNGKKYYDHALTEIEKGKLLDQINDQAAVNGFMSTGAEPNPSVTIGKDTKLFSILQINSSRILDDNGEPLVVDGLFLNLDDREPLDECYRAIDWAKSMLEKCMEAERVSGYKFDAREFDYSEAGDSFLYEYIRLPASVMFLFEALHHGYNPRLSVCFRYGGIRDNHRSYNSRDDVYENGVSVVGHVKDLNTDRSGYYEAFFGNSPYNIVLGVRNGYRGADSEVLLSPAYVVSTAENIGNVAKSATDNSGDFSSESDSILEREREEYEDGAEIGVYESGGRWHAEGFAFSRPTKEQLLDAVRSLYSDYAVSLSEDGRSFVMERIRYGGRRSYTKKQIDARRGRWKRQLRHAVDSIVDQMGIRDLVTVVEDSDGLTGRRANAKGWYDTRTGKVVVVLGNHANSSDVVMTIMHEVVGHYGLRRMFGEHFDAFLDNVYKSVTPEIRRDMDRLAERYGARLESESPGSVRSDESLRRLATEEYLAKLAEDTDYSRRGFHELMLTVRSLFLKMLHSIGLRGFDYDGLGENELRYLLWRSYENIVHPNEYRSILGEARDIVMRRRLKVDSAVAPASRGLVADAKSKHPEATFLERSGNGYAVRGEDAVKVAKVLGVSVGIEYGEPVVHIDATELDDVLPRLLKSGMRVAVVDAVGKVGESTVVYGETLDDVNRRFNDELEQQIMGKLSTGHVYSLGMPGKVLLSTGIPYLPIQMSASRLRAKSMSFGHDFDLSEIRDLVKLLQKPLAIFVYGDRAKSQNIIIPIQKDGKNFIVGLALNPKIGETNLEINSIRNVFPKDNSEWLNWITQGKALYLDKGKIQTLTDQQRTILADVEYLDLDSVAKITEDFENPKLSDEKKSESTLFRDGADPREEYDSEMRKSSFQVREAYQDSMLSLRRLMEIINRSVGRNKTMDYENPYMAENALSSKNNAEAREFTRQYYKPLVKVLRGDVFPMCLCTR